MDPDGLTQEQRRRVRLFPATAAALRNNVKLGEGAGRRGISLPTTNSLSPLFPAPPPLNLFSSGLTMGKEQELLDAARTGNLAAAEKLLSGKRQSAGGLSGTAGGGNSGASSHPLSSLLR